MSNASGDFVRKPHPEPHSPFTDTLTPGVPLDQIGQTLASFYDDLIAEGVPTHLANLVRRVKQAQPDTAAGPSRSDAPSCALKAGNLAIVVEDEADVRELAETLLEETQLEVIGCASAEEALSVLQQRGGEVAMVFADVRLAGEMDGLQLVRAISTLWPRVRLVVTSGQGVRRPDMPKDAVFIAKPWRAVDVLVEAERAAREPAPPVA
jgi:CheY-like chemotaxis protein